jgi:hypothetical protein
MGKWAVRMNWWWLCRRVGGDVVNGGALAAGHEGVVDSMSVFVVC